MTTKPPNISGNMFSGILEALPAECFATLFENRHAHIERIISQGHATPADHWYDQAWDEWVLLLQGAARLLFEDCATPLVLRGGDFVFIAAHRKHRVLWTDPDKQSIWLAIHLPPDEDQCAL